MNDRVKKTKKAINEMIEKVKQIGVLQLLLLLGAIGVLIMLSVPSQNENGKSEKSTKGGLFLERNEMEKSNAKEQTSATSTNEQMDSQQEHYKLQMEQQLKDLLEKVDGVGSVDVMISLKGSEETVYNKDIRTGEQTISAEGSSQSDYEENTILYEDSEGNQMPLLKRTDQPEVAGVVVICQGGDDPRVINDVTSAVEVLFSVSAHKVKVMKKLNK